MFPLSRNFAPQRLHSGPVHVATKDVPATTGSNLDAQLATPTIDGYT
jgi:hypothetical protein